VLPNLGQKEIDPREEEKNKLLTQNNTFPANLGAMPHTMCTG
jgi:hypothetical protein